MRWLIVLAAGVASFAAPTGKAAEDHTAGVEIPLKEMWALDMPGTKDVRDLEGHVLAQSLVSRISAGLQHLPAKQTKGFAVAGGRLDALKAAHGVLVEEAASPNPIPANREVTLVFFSQEFNCYVHLKSVERRADVITIKYVFVPHKTKELTSHLALIPMGHLPAGKWQVKIVQSPTQKKYKDSGFKSVTKKMAEQIVCGSFTFEVVLLDGVNVGH